MRKKFLIGGFFSLFLSLLPILSFAQDRVITMTTTKEIDEEIMLGVVVPKSSTVAFEGAEFVRDDSGYKVLRLTSKTIKVTIKGDVEAFDCFGNQITSLELSNCSSLQTLGCGSNQLKELDLSSCSSLSKFYCDGNQLQGLDFSKNKALKEIGITTNQIKGEKMSSLLASLCTVKSGVLAIMNLADKKEKNEPLKKDIKIAKDKGWKIKAWKIVDGNYEAVDYYGYDFDPLEAGKVTMTTAKAVGEEIRLQFETLDGTPYVIQGAEFVKNESVGMEEFQVFELKSQTVILGGDFVKLNCSENKITDLKLQVPSLKQLGCLDNELSSLDLSECPSLVLLGCDGNQLEGLDFSKNKKIEEISLSSNKIKGAKMTAMMESLPTIQQGRLAVLRQNVQNEENVCSKSDVQIAVAKGWMVGIWEIVNGEYQLNPYEGVDTAIENVKNGSEKISFSIINKQMIVKGIKKNVLVQIYDFSGRTLMKQESTMTNCSLDLKSLSKGSYVLRVGDKAFSFVL